MHAYVCMYLHTYLYASFNEFQMTQIFCNLILNSFSFLSVVFSLFSAYLMKMRETSILWHISLTKGTPFNSKYQ